jgi:sodium-dependent phosphate cotransporter
MSAAVVVDAKIPKDITEKQNATNLSANDDAPSGGVGGVMLVLNVAFLLFNLYFFLVGLGLMGDSFKVLAGKTAGNLFQAADHPIAGLMVGILATVLVQSSSTSTSIVVGLVGSGVMPVRQAVFVIMGANIGTSVTNTLVSLGHAKDPKEYERAFAGATVHDMFNFLCVLVLLPIEAIIGAVTGTGGLLFLISESLTSSLKTMSGGKFKSPVSTYIKPVYQAILKVDKDKIKALATGIPTIDTCLVKDGAKPLVVAKVNYHICGNETLLAESLESWDKNVIDGVLTKGGAFKGMDDLTSGGLGLTISLIILCLALFLLVMTLKKLFLGPARNCIGKAVKLNGALAIIVGAGMTIAVQSSSIITSALTPLVGIGTLPLEKMLPLTLGANIGTTFTAMLASLVISTDAAIQIALCHLLFNCVGLLVWYPIPMMRQVPINAAKWMGSMTLAFGWFPLAYIAVAFFFVPMIILGLSTMVGVGGYISIFGWILIAALVVGIIALTYWAKMMGGQEKISAFVEKNREANIAAMLEVSANNAGALEAEMSSA